MIPVRPAWLTRPLAWLICLPAAACGQGQPPLTQFSAPVDPAAAVASKLTGTAPYVARVPALLVVGDALLRVVAPEFPGCEPTPGAVVATARWDVSPLKVEHVSIFVESPGNPRKLWADGKAQGESVTGPWVSDHTQFTMTDKDSGRELARRTVVATPCK